MQAMLLQAAGASTNGTQGDLQRKQIQRQRLTFRLRVRRILSAVWDACIVVPWPATSKVDMPDSALERQTGELPATVQSAACCTALISLQDEGEWQAMHQVT